MTNLHKFDFLFVLFVIQTSGTYAVLEYSSDSGASTGSSGKGKGTVMQDDVHVNYGEIDHNRLNAANKSHPPAKPLNKTSYAELELSGGSTSGATGSFGKGKGTVMQDNVRVNYREIDHNRMNAANKSHPPAKPPHKRR